jgi:hypothetical protein
MHEWLCPAFRVPIITGMLLTAAEENKKHDHVDMGNQHHVPHSNPKAEKRSRVCLLDED